LLINHSVCINTWRSLDIWEFDLEKKVILLHESSLVKRAPKVCMRNMRYVNLRAADRAATSVIRSCCCECVCVMYIGLRALQNDHALSRNVVMALWQLVTRLSSSSNGSKYYLRRFFHTWNAAENIRWCHHQPSAVRHVAIDGLTG